MNLQDVLKRIIDDGIAVAKADYRLPEQKQKRDGAVAGFEACRGKTPAQLAVLLESARTNTREAHRSEATNYWEIRCFEAEVEWVCNCVSAILANQHLPVIVTPTYRGVMKAAEVVGVAT